MSMDFKQLDEMDQEVNQRKEEKSERRSLIDRIKQHEQQQDQLRLDENKKKKKKKIVSESKIESFNLEVNIVVALNKMQKEKGINKSKFVGMILRKALLEMGEI
jgi:hypothetical protein